MNFLHLIYAHVRALLITAIELPSILSKAWADEKARGPKNADGSPQSWSQQVKVEAEKRREKRLAARKQA
jgi:hypothetical protein